MAVDVGEAEVPAGVAVGEALMVDTEQVKDGGVPVVHRHRATLREKMQRYELLPELNLVLQGSLGGLSAGDHAEASGKQFNEGGPGFSAGFVFSIPLENNSAREAATADRETQAKYSAVKAFTADVEFIEARRTLQTASPAPGADETARTSAFLDTLLDAQDRRSNAAEEFIRAAANYQSALVNLERAKGQLLAYSDVTVVRSKDEKGLPQLHLEKGAREGKSSAPGK